MKITDSVKFIGVFDRKTDLFEGQYRIPEGISYNSYLIIDEKIAVTDSVDGAFTREWLENIEREIGDRCPDYIICHHMEPDHSASLAAFLGKYPSAKPVATAKAFTMMKNFFGEDFAARGITVGEGDTLSLGSHSLTFVTAPMVHWPEVMLSYDSTEKILFSADAFGRFGITESEEDWCAEARRYYMGIVGKYGAQVMSLLKKAAALDIEMICPLHGPVIKSGVEKCLELYSKWASYTPEEEGVAIAYTSIYSNTKRAAVMLYERLTEKGVRAELFDLARCDMAEAVAAAFRYTKTVLASPTYNGEVFPPMSAFISALSERGFKGRTVALIENGSWAPMAAKVMREKLSACKDISFAECGVKILSSVSEANIAEIEALANELV